MPLLTHLLSLERLLMVVAFVCIGNARPAALLHSLGDVSHEEVGGLRGENVTCHLNEEYVIPSNEIVRMCEGIIIVNPQRENSIVKNSTNPVGSYKCPSRSDKPIGRPTTDALKLPPQNVTDFSCRGYDYKMMRCNFTKPHSLLSTTYSLNYSTNNFQSSNSCHLFATSNDDGDNDEVYCEVETLVREHYYFVLDAVNELGVNRQYFTFNYYKNVIPGNISVDVRNITSDSVTLYWKIHRYAFFDNNNNNYEFNVQLKLSGRSTWCDATFGGIGDRGDFTITLKHLPYAYRSYDFRVRAKAQNTPPAEEMWSVPFVGKFTTEPRRPDRPPHAIAGSFYVDSTETHLNLYWENVTELERNGPGFKYFVDALSASGDVKFSIATHEPSVTLTWRGDQTYDYCLRAGNDLGNSTRSNCIRVNYRLSRNDVDALYSPRDVVSSYSNFTYTLTWMEPVKRDHLQNYSVFWCAAKTQTMNQCHGSMHFEYVNDVTFRVNSPSEQRINFAVSANYLTGSSGMRWSQCSADLSTDMVKLEPTATAVSPYAVRLAWDMERPCRSIIGGYNLTYCEVDDTQLCLHAPQTVVLPMAKEDYRNFTIEHLKPFSLYRIAMVMYSKAKKVGPLSDAVVVRTMEAAPTVPIDLEIRNNSITSTSAQILWSPPKERNGILRSYFICQSRISESGLGEEEVCSEQKVNDDNNSDKPLTYTIENLDSYSRYEVYVLARTVENSSRSNLIKFSTLIGIPTSPRKMSDADPSVIQWSPPLKPSGRVEFYVVAMTQRYTNGQENRKSFIKPGNIRSIQWSEKCEDNRQLSLDVRAVNVAHRSEFDNSTFAVFKQRQSTEKPSPSVSASVQSLRATTDTISQDPAFFDFHCFNVVSKDARANVSLADMKNILSDYSSLTDLEFLCSPWESLVQIQCPKGSDNRIRNYFIAICTSAICVAVMVKLLVAKCNKMREIQSILPEGLEDHNGKDAIYHNSDKRRSNDCLMTAKMEPNGFLNTIRQMLKSLVTATVNNSPDDNDNDNDDKLNTREIEKVVVTNPLASIGDDVDDDRLTQTPQDSLDASSSEGISSQTTDSLEMIDVNMV